MVLGIDFGTTRVVAAAVDRGNYPLVMFETPDGESRDWFPSLVAIRGNEVRYGWDAWPLASDAGWTVIRSLKRELSDAALDSDVTMLVRGMAEALRRSLVEKSTLRTKSAESIEVMLGVPANANNNQRFLTTEAFRAAGFQIIGLLNEPSAASIEFAHSERAATKRGLLVYDLGGGTFDASLVVTEGSTHRVVATAGIPTLGGDDFDERLADMALEGASACPDDLSAGERFRLLDACREVKEALNPNTRKLVVDLDRVRAGLGTVTIPAPDFYERCRPLIEQTRDLVEQLIATADPIDTLYVTGGGAELPAVARVLKEQFGRRVRRSAYMRSATAIGLAIGGDPRSGFRVQDRLTHHFGVWREAMDGRAAAFDLLVPAGTSLPGPGEEPHRILRTYQPAHNIGDFRFVECSHLNDDGQPAGDLSIWENIRFPFDPALAAAEILDDVPVLREGPGHGVVEEYACDSSGCIRVRISNESAGYSREYQLGSRKTPRARLARSGRRRG